MFQRMRRLGVGLALASLVAACGGGGGGGADFTLYTPAESEMTTRQQMDAVLAPLSDSGLDAADPDAAAEVAEALGGFLDAGLSRAESSDPASIRELAVQLGLRSMKFAGEGGRGRYTDTIDYTDDFGVHWVGQYTETDTALSLTGTGTTASTSVQVAVNMAASDTRVTTTMSVHGTLPTGSGGTVRIDVDLSLNVTANGGSGTLRQYIEVLDAARQLLDKAQVVVDMVMTAQSDTTVSTRLNSTWYFATKLAGGVFWVNHSEALNLGSDLDTGATLTVTGTVTTTASNQMRLDAAFNSDGTVTGTLKDQSGAVLATLSGRWASGHLTVEYAAGGTSTVYLSY